MFNLGNKRSKQIQTEVLIIVLVGFILFLAFNIFFLVDISPRWQKRADADATGTVQVAKAMVNWKEKLFPADGTELPVNLGDLGRQLVEKGVIDQVKLENLYANRGGLDGFSKQALSGSVDGNLRITRENASFLLNFFWALGLANQNPILEQGPMKDPQFGGAGNFASTGGWILADGDAMDHYSKHKLIALTEDQQALVEKVSKNIYRPCCDNATYFPDCNHGMAMLGFLELMASGGATEQEMYTAALKLNAYWFPGNYLTIAQFLETQGTSWEKAKPEEILGLAYSSSSGYRQILSRVNPVSASGGPSCGV